VAWLCLAVWALVFRKVYAALQPSRHRQRLAPAQTLSQPETAHPVIMIMNVSVSHL
jgi:hypothetical protein